MALSDQVKDELDSAQAHLREALAFAARNEKPFVVKALGEMIHAVDNLTTADEFMDTMQELIKEQEDGLSDFQ
jgi:cellobiose-specific phosphotransferase system component IIA|tara:strand:- start:5237 stop:5455 length:219 start_codon:yes stop_codon:yes gene_type:complete